MGRNRTPVDAEHMDRSSCAQQEPTAMKHLIAPVQGDARRNNDQRGQQRTEMSESGTGSSWSRHQAAYAKPAAQTNTQAMAAKQSSSSSGPLPSSQRLSTENSLQIGERMVSPQANKCEDDSGKVSACSGFSNDGKGRYAENRDCRQGLQHAHLYERKDDVKVPSMRVRGWREEHQAQCALG